MKTSQILFLLGFILVFGFMTNCSLDDNPVEDNRTGNDELAYNIARALSADSMLENEIIYKLCNKFDGDYSILFRYLSPEFAKRIPEITNTLYDGYELELRMPMASRWSLNEIEAAGGLVVAAVPFNVDDEAITRLTGYRKDGKKVILTRENSRSIPYILISCSERVGKDGIIMYGPNQGCHINEIYFSSISRSKKLDRSTKLGLIKKEDIPITLCNLRNDPYYNDLYIDDSSDPGSRGTLGPTPAPSAPPPTSPPTPIPVYLYSKLASYSNEIKVTQKTNVASTPGNEQTISIKQIYVQSGLDDDGWPHWIDGDLELEFKFYQDLLEMDINLQTIVNFNGTVSFEYRDFYIYRADCDWDDNTTFYVNYTTPLFMLQSFQIPFTNYYLFNKKLRIKVIEWDDWSSNEEYLHTDFNVDLFFNAYNDKWWFPHNKIGFLIATNNYLFLC